MTSSAIAASAASDTTFCIGVPPNPPPPDSPAATALDDWPTLIGTLTGITTWYPETGSDPPIEVAHVLIAVKCDRCDCENRHGWSLDGSLEPDLLKARHCRCPGRYNVRPAQPGEVGYDLHAFDPAVRVTRPARKGRPR